MKLVKYLLIMLVFSFLTSCLAHIVTTEVASGKMEQFTGVYYLENLPKNPKDKLISVMKELKFKRSSNVGMNFDKQSGKGARYGLGKFYSIVVTGNIENDKIKLTISQTGNYKYGTEEKTNKTFEEIKEKFFK